MSARLEGKVALVTGGASGIGEATAVLFGQEGAQVVVADVDADAGEDTAGAIRRAGGVASFVRCDVTDPAEVQDLVATALRMYGRLDCAVNNAGVNGPRTPMTEFPDEIWDRVMAVDLKGVWLCTTRELRAMASQGHGTIVNMASVAGVVGFPYIAPYTAAKFGVRGLTKAAALEYAASNIRVNAVCPAYVDTPLVAAGIRRASRGADAYDEIAEIHPMKRLATVAEVAEAVLWLSSDLSSFVTGTELVVDGGYLAGQRVTGGIVTSPVRPDGA